MYSTRQGHNVPKSKDDEGLVQKNAGYFFYYNLLLPNPCFHYSTFFFGILYILPYNINILWHIGKKHRHNFLHWLCVCVCSQDKNLGQYVPKSQDSEGLVQKKAYKDLYVILKVIFYCKLL